MAHAMKMASSDATTGSFPSFYDWAIEIYWRLPFKPQAGEVYIVTDGGDDFWIRLIGNGSTITVEATCRQAVDGDPNEYGELATLTGEVPNDGCWHQVVWFADLSDANYSILYLDGAEAFFDGDFLPYDFSGGTWPAFFRWGAFLGTEGMTVDLSHIALYDLGIE